MPGDGRSVTWQPGPAVSVFAAGLFEGTVAVVTGGGSGLDEVVAYSAIHKAGAVAVPTNIREPAQVDALRDTVYERYGRVDFLVNNAGGQYPGLPSTISDNGWRAVVDLNLNGTWNVTSRFMGPMAEAGSGAIVTIVHTFSLERGAPMFVHSGAARAGVVNMVKTLAPYLMRRGVTINAFAPGVFSTPGMIESELAGVGRTEAGFTDELVAEGTTVRLGTADEMAAMVLYLCSPAARYVCGATIVADGASMQTNWVSFFPEEAM